ncbi:MAG: alpha-2-macroglobulin family protein [Bacteroidales bacterium]
MKSMVRILSVTFLLLIFYQNPKAQEMEFYAKKWKEVDSLERKALPKSALEIVEQILVRAKADNNSQQVIKSFIFRLKYKNTNEENAFEKLCYELDSSIQTAKFPDKAIMHSMLAEMYWWYYQNNRYKFYNRSTTVNFDNQDMQTWSLDNLVDKIIKEHTLALADKDGLQKLPKDQYNELIFYGSKPAELRPTLYDFIAQRALDFFYNTEISLSKPADYFQLKEDFYFADAKIFANQNIVSNDSLSLNYQAIKLLQELTKFRLGRENEPAAMLDLDLKRIEFANLFSVHPDKDNLYIQALNRLEKQYKNIQWVAEVLYKKAVYYNGQSSRFNPLEKETFKYKNLKVVSRDICKDLIKNYSGTNAAEFANQLKNEIETHHLQFEAENMVAPNMVFSAKVSYRNCQQIFVRVGSFDELKFNKLSEKYYSEELYDKVLSSVKTVYQKSFVLPVDSDFNQHSAEILLQGLPLGFYIVFVSNNEKFSYQNNMASYRGLRVSAISYMTQAMPDGSHRFLLTDRTTGWPISGVKCQTWKSSYSYVSRRYVRKNGPVYYSDKNGFVFLPAQKSDYNDQWGADFSKGTDMISTDNSFYLYKNEYTVSSTVRTTYFTDRAIYRPGQTVFFKGISIRSTGDKHEVETNTPVTVYFYDVNRQKVSELELKTNEFGTFSGKFDIPMGLLNGNFTIESSYGSKSLSVEEYKRPKFEVKLDPFKGNYILNDNVEISGVAKSYSGAALSDASVKFRIIRTPRWYGWWSWYFNQTPVEIKNGTISTDENGKFTIGFKAIPDLSYEENEYLAFNYSIVVDVTDINGETQSTTGNVSVGYRALQVSLPVDGLMNKLDSGLTEVRIVTQNLNYEFIPAKGDIKIYKLKSGSGVLRLRHWTRPDKHLYTKDEWYSQFPGNVFDNENEVQQMEIDKEVFSRQFDTEKVKNIDLSFVKNFETGDYVVEINSVDAFGKPVSNRHFFKLFDPSLQTMSYTQSGMFNPVKIQCEPGEKAEFIIGSSFSDVKVLYEIEHKGNIISTDIISINNEQKSIIIPVEEKHRGNFSVHFVFMKDNRFYNYSEVVYVPYSNKVLDIEFETFRDKLYPGQQEKWRLKIKGPKGDKVAAEMLATLYDASLDVFRKNYWDFNVYNSYYTQRSWQSGTIGYYASTLLKVGLDNYYYPSQLYYDGFNWFGFNYYPGYYFYPSVADDAQLSEVVVASTGNKNRSKGMAKKSEGPPPPPSEMAEKSKDEEREEFNVGGIKEDGDLTVVEDDRKQADTPKEDFSEVKVRTNFNETAFFYPHLMTNEEGEIIVEFTVPEALTKWRMMGFATTKDIKFGSIANELITQKDLMLLPNEPRFFRENDKIVFPVKISNISTSNLNGKIKLELTDALTLKPVEGIFIKSETDTKDFEVKAGENTLVSWSLQIPEGVGAIQYKVVAKAGDFSDGEQKVIPVLTNRMLVTESLPLPIRANQTKTFLFDKLLNSGKSNTIRNQKFTLEFTSNPAWYAVQALPYLFEFPYECIEQTFSRYYANSIASYIANSSPKIKVVFDSWKNTPNSQALLSNLEKNQELKAVLLEETPWVLEGKDESERKNRVGLLFDLNRMAGELETALKKVQKAQKSNGAWPWFDGMPESRYITQHIVSSMGHLDKLGVKTVREDNRTWKMLQNAIEYLDERIREDYQYLKKYYNEAELKEDHLSYEAVHYLYGRSYFTDIPVPERSKQAFDYFKGQSEKYWLNRGKYTQGMIALYLNRFGNKTIPADIVKSLKEFSTSNEEMGMYWKDNVAGWYWYQAPIETQALMIEVFDEVTNDQQAVNEMKIWLLKQKQTQDWKTTRATTEAVYALLKQGTNWLESDKLAEITIGDQKIDPTKMKDVKVEAGTGYFKTSWPGEEVKPSMGKITVKKDTEGIAWGAVYWQYFEQLDKITTHETPLKLKKQLFIERLTEKGKIIEPVSDKSQLKIGDKVIVRIELRSDRAMEYIHMKDMRASGFEPINVISTYKYQDGLGYYESTKDAATNFFMEYLPKGTYVFEYPLRVTHLGDFSNGITTIQCMYAPEFTSHSEGIRVKVEK